MILLFWISTILLVLATVGAFYGPTARWGAAANVLVVIDLVILGLKIFGAPH